MSIGKGKTAVADVRAKTTARVKKVADKRKAAAASLATGTAPVAPANNSAPASAAAAEAFELAKA
jgi:hypothetical protein